MAAKRGSPVEPAADGPLRRLVRQCAAAMGATVDPASETALNAWLERLQEWNERMDLTAARSAPELVDLMVADALALATRVPPRARLGDVGAGAGAPGLALALLRPDLQVTLVEPLGKRASFLRTAAGVAQRPDVAIERLRGEALEGRRRWDVAISRATLAPPEWLRLGASLVVPGGAVVVLVAKDAAPDAGPAAVLEGQHEYRWPLTGADRRVLIYRVAPE